MKNLKKYTKILLILFFIIFLFVKLNMSYILVFSESMSPTLDKDDKVICINKNIVSINIDDIIVFKNNDENIGAEYLIKRVVAKENDYVKIDDNKLFVNNKFIKDIGDINSERLDLVLSKDEFFVLGDNVNNSYDSRNYGPVSYNQILSKVIFIIKK